MTIDRSELEKAIVALEVCPWTSTHNAVLVAASRAHLETLPKVKTITRWMVTYIYSGKPNTTVYETEGDAERGAARIRATREAPACVEVIPFEQKVPS